ncbi:MAG TPA: PrgI family protein [Candidatus Dormibacteraeota bacterium]|nr:PrgI family protein [Candidatus Dormibacteraeota bacterium]
MATRHEIPTHLNVEDRAFYGLTVRQVMFLTAGAAAGYSLWNQWPTVLIELRLGLAMACFALAVVVALVRPQGRGLEEWAFVVLHYAAVPKVCTWQPAEPDVVGWSSPADRWEELEPHVTWRSGSDDQEVAP